MKQISKDLDIIVGRAVNVCVISKYGHMSVSNTEIKEA